MAVLDRLTSAPDDAPSCDSRIPSTVSLAFRRAVRRVTAAHEINAACDVDTSRDASRALAAISDAVRRTYVRGRSGPVGAHPVAARVFRDLRQAFIEELDVLRASLRSGELTEAMRAFDLVHEEMDRDETQRFVAALQSGDAVDLVVEVAHDMRSPLTTILMLTEVVRRTRTAGLDDPSARQLGLVYSAAFALNALVNDVIALARGGDRLIDRECVPFSTSALMLSVADILRPIADDRHLALEVVGPASDVRLGQPLALSRVLLNLAGNGLKFTDTGAVTMRATDIGNARLRFEVADTGPGMPSDVLTWLSEPFAERPGGAHGRRFSSSGLGLAICRKLLREMASELEVHSLNEGGTRFSFELTLPLADGYQPARGDRVGSRGTTA